MTHFARLRGGHLRLQRQRAVACASSAAAARSISRISTLAAPDRCPSACRPSSGVGERHVIADPARLGRRPRGTAARPAPACAGSFLRRGQFEQQTTTFIDVVVADAESSRT